MLLWPHSATHFFARPWRGTAILWATMATSAQRGKGFGRTQWVLSERCCRCCLALHWVCAASIPSPGLSGHGYDGALFSQTAPGHSVGNGHHLRHRTLTWRALSNQGRRWSGQGQTITLHNSIICNEPEIEKLNWAVPRYTEIKRAKFNHIQYVFLLLLCFLCISCTFAVLLFF